MKTILKPMLAMGVVMVSLLITATSCDKKAAGGSSGGRVGELEPRRIVGTLNNVSVRGNVVSIRANWLANELTPLSDANDANRSFGDISRAHSTSIKKYVLPFAVVYPGAKAAMVFVNRAHVTKDTISLRAYNDCSEDSESGDNTFAKADGGGACRYIYNDNLIVLNSILGTVFNNTRTTSRARGTMACSSYLHRQNGSSSEYPTITDTLKFNKYAAADCYMGVVNNGLGSRVEINNSWVFDRSSVTEVELYAIGIDVSEKTISEFSSASGFNRHEFAKALDNAAFKKMLEKNQWRDLRFKVRIY